MKAIQNIAVLTSGGDAPGMNAAIRAVVRTSIFHGKKIFGIRRGYQGLIEGDLFEMEATSVSKIIQLGGTILKTARSQTFTTDEGRAQAFQQLKKKNIDALILIGGDGTFRGASDFFKTYAIPAIGIPGTIDKDLTGSDFTIGFDTAVNTAVRAIDNIRDTAEAHDRLFIVEVMGRDAGFIALHSGLSCGAEDILIPETRTNVSDILNQIANDRKRKKTVQIIVVAEGDDFGGAQELELIVKEKFPKIDVRSTILGHIQRGGSPTSADRVLASRLGYSAVTGLLKGHSQVMVGIVNNELVFTPFDQCTKSEGVLAEDLLEMIRVLAV